MKLRPYQQTAHEKAVEALERGHNPLIIMPTGTGKTVVFSSIIHSVPGNFLTLAHSRELIHQAVDKIKRFAGIDSTIEMANQKSLCATKSTVGSVQTMTRRIHNFEGDFDYILTDEAHRSVAQSYLNVYENWPDALRLGFTATPDRADNKSLSSIYDTIAYQYSLADAIKDKWLVPIKAKRVSDFDIDISELRIKRGDLDDAELGRIMIDYVEPISNSIIGEMEDKKSLVFMPNVDSSIILSDVLNGKGVSAAALHGKLSTSERDDILYRFRIGAIQYLISCQILLEGYDEPSIEGIVMLRPTQSRSLYAQAVGRGTRLHEGKEAMHLLEFTYNYKRLKLVSPYELFTASGFEQRVQDFAGEISEDGVDLLESLEVATRAYYSLDRILVAVIKGKDRYKFIEFDPLAVADYLRADYYSETPVFYEGRKLTGPITDGQKNYLIRFNIANLDEMTKAQASLLIDGFQKNEIIPLKGPATPKQMAWLEKRGVGTEGMTKAQASMLIRMIKEKKKRA